MHTQFYRSTNLNTQYNGNFLPKYIFDSNEEFNDSLEIDSISKFKEDSKKCVFESFDIIEQDSLDTNRYNESKLSKACEAQNNNTEQDRNYDCTVENVALNEQTNTNHNLLQSTNGSVDGDNIEHEYEIIDLPGNKL